MPINVQFGDLLKPVINYLMILRPVFTWFFSGAFIESNIDMFKVMLSKNSFQRAYVIFIDGIKNHDWLIIH